MIQPGKMYKLFANCVRHKGYRRAIIYDLQRNQYHLIPHSLFDLFDEHDILMLEPHGFPKEETEILQEYVAFLSEHSLIFPIDKDELSLFPQLNRQWKFPSIATNMIIDAGRQKICWDEVVLQLEQVKCYYLQIRFFAPATLTQLESIANSFRSSLVHAFEILAPFDEELEQRTISKYTNNTPKLRTIIFYNAPENKEVQTGQNGFCSIYFIKEQITSALHCGIIHPSYFTSNIETYTESLAHNTCLNRKISIDIDGNIKNCPSMKESYGNIKDTSLKEAINKPGFTKYWNINKDQITKCKDCEFRHICTDCRAYLETPEDIYSAPLKCGYNPYTCEWEEWSINPLKQKAIEHYGLKKLIFKL